MAAEIGRESVRDLEPEEVARGMAEGKVLLVDVREPNETDVERYPEAFYLPMSVFDAAAIPDPQGRQVVFACRSGNRTLGPVPGAIRPVTRSSGVIPGCFRSLPDPPGAGI